MSKQVDAFALAGRLLMTVLFLMSGFGKIMNPQGTIAMIGTVGLPLPTVAYAVSVFVEIAGPVLLAIGWQTRLTAAAFCVYVIATALVFHTHFADQNQLFHFLKNIAIAGGFFQVMAFGAGKYSLDARLAAASPA